MLENHCITNAVVLETNRKGGCQEEREWQGGGLSQFISSSSFLKADAIYEHVQ